MELPAITLPKIDLPFDIPVLLHPPVDHFAIALPVIILLLELYNLFVKRRSIGAFSFILLVITVVVFALAYLTGSTDGKEAYDLLSPEGQGELKAHKLLGTYLLLASVVVLFFKLLAMTGKGFFKFIFFAVLIAFIVFTFKQGKDGGELVYEYGANVERVKVLDDEIFDLKEALEEADPSEATETPTPTPTVEKQESSQEDTNTSTQEPVQEDSAAQTPTKEIQEPSKEDANTSMQSVSAKVETLLDSAKQEIEEASQKVLTSVQETATDTVEKVSEMLPTPTEAPQAEQPEIH